MITTKHRRFIILGAGLLLFLVFMVVMYIVGVQGARSKYQAHTEEQYTQFLLTQKSFIRSTIEQIEHAQKSNFHETDKIIHKIVESESQNSDFYAQYAIIAENGSFLYHPIYNGRSLRYIQDNYDAEVYHTIMDTNEGMLHVPQNPYNPDMSQVIYYTTIEELGWRLLLIEDRTDFEEIELFRQRFYEISAGLLTLIFLGMSYAFYHTILLLNRTQDMNLNLESIVQDRTMAVLTNNRELEYAAQEAEEAKERVIQSNEELNQMIQQILETQEKLIESEKLASLGGIVAGVAHEINTPLGTALTSATFLEELIKDAEKDFTDNQLTKRKFAAFLSDFKDTCHMLTDSLFRTSQLVLSFKQIAVDQSDTQRIQFDLCDYLHKIVLSLKHEYKNTNHDIKIHCSGNIVIESYPGAFAQILTNLIINSLKHGFDGMIEGTITIDVKKVDHNLFLLYSDDGKGIAKSDLKRIFEPFFTTKRGAGGSGLGMNIVYNLVTQKLNGTIQVKSERNNGVKFIMQIPV